MMKRTRIVLFGVLTFFTLHTVADVTRASRMVDRVVLTSEGELLGRVEDLALEEGTLKVAYVVVSVGSYLIDNNLIAVTPQSLTESESGEYLVIPADALVDAPRFNQDSWPDEAQVDIPVIKDERLPPAEVNPGVAEIVGSNRRLTLDQAGQKSVTQFDQPIVRATPSPRTDGQEVQQKTWRAGVLDGSSGDETFRRFDTNQDGYLSRREIAPYFKPGLRFSDYDSDGNGGLDPFEMKVLQENQ